MSIDPADLERLTDRALRRLPAPRTPGTLLPRVMAAAGRHASRPWYARAWWSWPAHWQAAAAVGALLVAVSAALVAPGVLAAARELSWTIDLPVPSAVAGLVQNIAAGWEAWRVVWRVMVEPIAGYLAVFVLAMSLACVAFGTALDRVVALGGAVKS